MADASGKPNVLLRGYVIVLAVVIGLCGLVLAGGGAWLLSLGGSWYYLVAGVGLVLAAFFMLRGRVLGAWIYGITFLFTLVWALWERGFNGWAQVPRLVAPTVLLLLVLLAVPVLRRLDYRRPAAEGRAAMAAMAGIVAAGLAILAQPLWQPPAVVAQVTTPPATPAPAEPTPAPGDAAPAPAVPAPAEPAPATPAAPAAPGAPAQTPAAPADLPAQPAAPTAAAPSAPAGPPMLAAANPEATLEAGADWPAYGGTYHAMRYSPLDQINRDNVGQLKQFWEFRTGDMPPPDAGDGGSYSPENTPLKVGDTVFVCSAMGIVIGVDAASGGEEWRFDPKVSRDAIPYGATCRGVAYYAVPDADPDSACATRIIWGTLDARLIAVDARTGLPCADFGTQGEVNLDDGIGDTVPGWYAITSPPTIVRGIAVLGAQVQDGQAEDSPSGVIRGYDAVTGELAWAWDLGNPELTGEPPEGEVYTRGTPNMWTTASGDEELGYVYLPLGNSAVDYYGSNRSENENEFATSIVALDVTTGEPVWHFQAVHHDVWDYDLGSQVTLVDFPVNGSPVPALILPGKQGDLYVLDRRSGEPLTPVEERPVPQGGVEPDFISATQPFSQYHTLARPPLTEADMWGATPIDQMMCRIQFRQSNYEGMYTPPSTDRFWIQYPGYNGGSDWGSIAVDPERGILIANYNDMPNHNRLVPRAEADAAGLQPIYVPNAPKHTSLGEAGPQAGAPYAIDVNAGWRMPWTGLLCKQPPYGGIRAIELATGRTLWDRPFGTARNNGPFGIPSMLPLTIGTPNNGGPVVTAGGLIFIAAATDGLFRAIDATTGDTVWQVSLPAGGQATPFTYEINGKEVVGIMAGGHHFMETPVGDYVLTWALP